MQITYRIHAYAPAGADPADQWTKCPPEDIRKNGYVKKHFTQGKNYAKAVTPLESAFEFYGTKVAYAPEL